MLQDLPLVADKGCVRILSIDPGTVTLGFAIIDVNLDTYSVTVRDVFTYNAAKTFNTREEYKELFGSRTLRLKLLSDAIYDQLTTFLPNIVIAESAYMGRMVTSFESLTECRSFLRDAVKRYDDGQKLELIDPMTVKYGIGAVVKGEARKRHKKGKKRVDTKVAVRNRIGSLIDLLWDPTIPAIQYLDEHSVDAISIGYWRAQELIRFEQADIANYVSFRKSVGFKQ